MSVSTISLDRRKGGWLTRWTRWVMAAAIMTATLSTAAESKTQADYFVKSLPGQPDGPLLKMHAG
jgi:carboxypeptidase D